MSMQSPEVVTTTKPPVAILKGTESKNMIMHKHSRLKQKERGIGFDWSTNDEVIDDRVS